jgi:hypothetical protein
VRCQLRGPFFQSVNAKQLAQPDFQSGPNRCKSDHGCNFVRVAQLDSERHHAKVEVAGAIPAVDANFAPVPQQLQGEFRKLVFVGASPTRGSNFKSGAWCN